MGAKGREVSAQVAALTSAQGPAHEGCPQFLRNSACPALLAAHGFPKSASSSCGQSQQAAGTSPDSQKKTRRVKSPSVESQAKVKGQRWLKRASQHKQRTLGTHLLRSVDQGFPRSLARCNPLESWGPALGF
ncbi:hypothetical protein mRhiFer1_008571 [Rhinolophus ferrumequinum]|uniref:Uncharacterized protein n=1 Tax=Rhinolophus ferrumequinum TaxID=59479 RepID=A0A7J7UJW3_RHIFE|nr:hypothetical protein mRhiFer1_008571 [Rhinolophus ferrumequinum]